MANKPKTNKAIVTDKEKKSVAEKLQKNNNNGKTMKGIIVSAKMQNTVVVAIERKVPHKRYRKLIKVTKKIKADTNNIKLSEGDLVVIQQTRPISKDKNFRVIRKEEINN